MSFVDIVWANSYLIPYVTIIAIILGGILILHMHLVHKKIDILTVPKRLHQQFIGYSRIRRYVKGILYLVGIICLLLALLNPQWNQQKQLVKQEGRDLLIALDISRSMLAKDLQPNRLAFAKEKIKTLLEKLQAERVGLILFAGGAIVQCPLTTDTSAFNLFLNDVDEGTVASGTTSIAQAIQKAIDIYSKIPAKKTKLLVVFTDGEDFSRDLSSLKQRAKKEGVTIFTVGVGTKHGAPVPIINQYGKQEGHQKDADGSVVISRLDEEVLRSVAQEAGGIYLQSSQDDQDVDALLHAVRKFEKESFDAQSFQLTEAQYPYFVGISLICLALEWIL